MPNYRLMPDEFMIMKSEHVVIEDEGTLLSDGPIGDMLLTNKNIVFLEHGLLGGYKKPRLFPMSSIKVFDNRAQVMFNEAEYGRADVEIYFADQQHTFRFRNRAEAVKWMGSVDHLLTGRDPGSVFDELGSKEISSNIKDWAQELSEAIGVLKSAFGVEKREPVMMASAVCPTCGASVSGVKGATVRCEFCDGYISL